MRKIVFLCYLMSTMLCAASNVISRTAVYCRNLDNRSDYGLDKTAEYRVKSLVENYAELVKVIL